MATSTFKHVKIKGISTVIPEKEICIYDEAKYYDNDIKKIDRLRRMVGFHKRRVVENNVTASDLAIQATENLIRDMAIDKRSIDALIYVNQRPDFRQPATSFYIHHRLKLPEECQVIDVTHGCPGWVYGLWIGGQMVESQACKRVLLLVGDTPSANINLSDRISAPVFGDGAAATLLEYSEDTFLSYFNIETHSQDYEAIATPIPGARSSFNLFKKEDIDLYIKLLTTPIKTESGHDTTVFHGYMDGMAVFNFTLSVVPKNIKALMAYADVSIQDIECLCLHQANKQIIQTVGGACGFSDDKVPFFVFENFGNSTLASIPITITSTLNEKLIKGPTTILCSGFGNGLACASCILTLDNIYSPGTMEYKLPENHMTRDNYLKHWIQKLKGEKK